MHFVNKDHTLIDAGDGRTIPVDPLNSDYAGVLASGVEIATYVAPGPTSSDVNKERDRRLATVTFQGHIFDFLDKEGSDRNIESAANLAFAAIMSGKAKGDLRWSDPDHDFGWIAHDNAIVPMDAETVVALNKSASAWKSAHMLAARAIKDLGTIPADYAADSRWPVP